MKHLEFDLKQPSLLATASSTSTSVPAYAAEPAIVVLLDDCEHGVVWRPDDGGAPQSARVPTAAERQALEVRRERLANCLRGSGSYEAEQRKAGAAIAEMLDGFLRFRRLDLAEKQTMIAGCVKDLAALPAWAIRLACEKIRRGEIEGLSLDWPPTSPRLFQLANAELAPVREEQRRIDVAMRMLPPGGVPESERARVGAKMRELADALREQERPEPPPTPDQIRERLGVSRAQWDAIPDRT